MNLAFDLYLYLAIGTKHRMNPDLSLFYFSCGCIDLLVNGHQAVERLGRSVLKSEKLPDDILILSCEEDYDICVPFLEKGLESPLIPSYYRFYMISMYANT